MSRSPEDLLLSEKHKFLLRLQTDVMQDGQNIRNICLLKRWNLHFTRLTVRYIWSKSALCHYTSQIVYKSQRSIEYAVYNINITAPYDLLHHTLSTDCTSAETLPGRLWLITVWAIKKRETILLILQVNTPRFQPPIWEYFKHRSYLNIESHLNMYCCPDLVPGRRCRQRKRHEMTGESTQLHHVLMMSC